MYDLSYRELCVCSLLLKWKSKKLPQSVQMSPSIITNLLNAYYILSESQRTIWRVIRFLKKTYPGFALKNTLK